MTTDSASKTVARDRAQAAHRAYRGVSFFASLDGVRFLCIVAVMWHHSPARGSLTESILLLKRGFTGVDFFFVLSGFLITTLLLREESTNGRFSLSGFYWRRALRILPVYLLVITAVSGYYVLVKGADHFAPLVPYYYLFLANFLNADIPLLSITWSLSVEEQFYLVWPTLLILLPVAGRMRLFFLVIAIAALVASAAGVFSGLGRPPETEHAVFGLPASSYAPLLIGALSAILLHRRRSFEVLYPVLGHPMAPVVAFIGLVALLSFLPGRLTGWPNLLLHSGMAFCLMTLVVREDNALRPLLTLRPVARIGAISYGLYLYHLIGLHIANETVTGLELAGPLAPWVITGLFFVIAIFMAEISFRTYEAYFLSLKSSPPFRWKSRCRNERSSGI